MGSKERGSCWVRSAFVSLGLGRAEQGRAGVVVSSYYGYLGASFLSTIIFLISVNVPMRVCVRLLCVSLSVCVDVVVVVCSIFACY